MARDIGHDRCDIIKIINSVEIIPSALPRDLPPEILARAQEIDAENKAKHGDKYHNGSKLGTEVIVLRGPHAAIITNPNQNYAQVLASREVPYSPNASPVEEMYEAHGNEQLMVLTKRNLSHVNPYTQGMFLLVNPEGNQAKLEDLPILIVNRGQGVDHGSGLRHHLAGYADHKKGFEDFRFNEYDGQRSIYQEGKEEGELTAADLVGAPQPFALAQDPFELQLHYAAITSLTILELRKRLGLAEDSDEHDKIDFVPIKDLEAFAAAHTFYSHSRPIVQNHVEDLMQKYHAMRGIKKTISIVSSA